MYICSVKFNGRKIYGHKRKDYEEVLRQGKRNGAVAGNAAADYTSEDLLALWTITGGVARYIEILMNNRCTNVKKLVAEQRRKCQG